VESTVCRRGVVSLTARRPRLPPNECKSGRNDNGQCGQAGGAGAHELTDVCSRPHRRALNFIGLGRETKDRGSKALAFVFAVGERCGSGA
jgi:hypothetical protein